MIDLNGLPEELLKQLSKKRVPRQDTMRGRILSSIGSDTMSIDEVLVSVYRKHGLIFNRKHLVVHMSKLKKDGFLERPRAGRWRLQKTAASQTTR